MNILIIAHVIITLILCILMYASLAADEKSNRGIVIGMAVFVTIFLITTLFIDLNYVIYG